LVAGDATGAPGRAVEGGLKLIGEIAINSYLGSYRRGIGGFERNRQYFAVGQL
jgi:hypothetical protein